MRQLIIPQMFFDEMIAHCREGYPYEACGILAGKDTEITAIYKMTNVERSPVSYLLDPNEQFRVMKEMRDKGLSMLGIFHSHPSSPPYPSSKDVSLAFYEDALYVIVSLMNHEPVVKAFTIREGTVEEGILTVKKG